MHPPHKVRCRAVVLHEEKLLLVKNSRGSDYYALPGGHLDPGETPLECMKRELIEELGVTPHIGSLLYVYTFVDREGASSVEFFFEITNGADFLSHETRVRTHAHELSEVRWITSADELLFLPEEIHRDFKSNSLLRNTVRFIKGNALDK